MDLIKDVFPEQSKNELIQYLKKKEYETFYSTKNKWPYLVIERLSMQTGNPAPGNEKINRELVEDPFGPDKNIKPEHSFTPEDYSIMMSYGISPGHNAPAGHHYTSEEIWSETFSYANICPQEMTFNSGIWVLLENWCKYISKQQKQKNFTNLRVFTGSIPDNKETELIIGDKSVMVNIPTHMFKMVCVRSKDKGNENKIYMGCFIYPNRPLDPELKENQDLYRWMVPFQTLKKLSSINFEPLLKKYYGYVENITQFENINDIVPVVFELTPIFKKQMLKSIWYAIIIYSSTVEQLEKNWEYCEKALIGENLEYHKDFYNLVKKRLKNKLTQEEINELEEVSQKMSMAGEPVLNLRNERIIPKPRNLLKNQKVNFFKLLNKAK